MSFRQAVYNTYTAWYDGTTNKPKEHIMTDFDRFVQWFNQNLKGETIFTVDAPTLRRRLRQWDHLDGNNADESMDLAFDVHFAREMALA